MQACYTAQKVSSLCKTIALRRKLIAPTAVTVCINLPGGLFSRIFACWTQESVQVILNQILG